MPERIALVLVLGIGLTLAILFTRRWNARRVAALQFNLPDWQALGVEPDDRRTLIAFSTPSCAACHQAQAPAIERVRQQLGEQALRVVSIDAARQPEAARAFGILTVPSTVVVGERGQRIVAINQGFAPSARLVEQLSHA